MTSGRSGFKTRLRAYSGIILLGLPLFQNIAYSNSDRVKLVLNNTPKKVNVSDLSWRSFSFPASVKTEGKKTIVEVQLDGNYYNKKGKLFYLEHGSSKPSNIILDENNERSFRIKVPLSGEVTRIELTAVFPSGKYQKDQFELIFPNYKKAIEGNKSGWNFELKPVRILGGYFKNQIGSFGTPVLSWNPRYGNSNVRFLGNFGFAPLRNGSLYYFEVEYGLGAAVRVFGRYWLEAMGGMQYWTDYKTHRPSFGSNVIYQFDPKPGFRIDQIVLGYSAYLAPDNLTSEIKFGLGFNF